MKPGTLYVDSSALVKLVRSEAETEALAAFLADRVLAATTIARVEVLRAIRRAGGSEAEVQRAQHVLAALYLVPPDDDILDRASRLGPPSLRTLDALHLATAMAVAADIDAFVAYDASLLEAARSAGLEVASPGP